MAILTINNKPLIEPYSIYIPEKSFENLLKYANEDISCELLDGVLVIHSPASFKHESIFKFLLTLLEIYGTKKKIGTPFGSRFMMKLSDKWAPEPDIMFLTPDDQINLQENYLLGPASVVFEILSKTTRIDDLEKKLPNFLKFGVKEVWIIDPEEQKVEIHWPTAKSTFSDDTWVTSKIITNFKIKMSWLWEPDKKSVLEAFNEIK